MMNREKIIKDIKLTCSYFSIRKEIDDEEYIEEEQMWQQLLEAFIEGFVSPDLMDYDVSDYVNAFSRVLEKRKTLLFVKYYNEGSEECVYWKKRFLGSLICVVCRCALEIKTVSETCGLYNDDKKFSEKFGCSRRGLDLLQKRLGQIAGYDELCGIDVSEEMVNGLDLNENVLKDDSVETDSIVNAQTVDEYMGAILTYEFLEDVPQIVSQKEVMSVYKIAAEYGSAFAMNKLGLYYLENANFEAAFDVFNEALNRGYAGAFVEMGQMYWNGNYVEKDYDKARSMFHKAIDLIEDKLDRPDLQLIYAKAMYGLGMLNVRTGCSDWEIEVFHCFAEAMYYFRKQYPECKWKSDWRYNSALVQVSCMTDLLENERG